MALYIDKNVYVGDTGYQLSRLGELAPISHASSATTYGVGTASNYGHCRVINNLTTSSATNGYALQAYQGKVLNNKIAALDVNYQTDTEVATNERVDGKRVYAKRLYVVCSFGGGVTQSVAHGISTFTDIWLDSGMSHMIATDTMNTIIGMPSVSYYANFSDRVSYIIDKTNITLYGDTGWGNRWKAVLIIKYTKD